MTNADARAWVLMAVGAGAVVASFFTGEIEHAFIGSALLGAGPIAKAQDEVGKQ